MEIVSGETTGIAGTLHGTIDKGNIERYLKTEERKDLDHYIVSASLHDDQGIMGCLELVRRAVCEETD